MSDKDQKNPLEMTMSIEDFKSLQLTAPQSRSQRTEADYLSLIDNKAMTAEAIAAEFGLAASTVKHRLKKLADGGYLERRKADKSKIVFYGATKKKWVEPPKETKAE